jgi:ketosteroid isomerase-like protein
MKARTFEEVLERQRVALEEFMHGNTKPFKDLYSRREGATLANPFGGVARGWAEIPDRLDRAASYYEEGEVVRFESISSGHSGDLGYAIEIEHIRARVGGRSIFDNVALRTTTVYVHEDSGWRLLHRHADPAADLQPPESIVR